MASPLAEALAQLGQLLGRLGVDGYLFGAQAAILHGAARTTADIDFTADIGSVAIDRLISEARAQGLDVRVPDPVAFIERTRVLPLRHTQTGIPIDLVIAGSPLEQEFLLRARPLSIEGVTLKVATAEDVIVMKVLAGRGKDLDDVRAIVAAQAGALDLERIRDLLSQLDQALDRSDLLTVFEDIHSGLRRR